MPLAPATPLTPATPATTATTSAPLKSPTSEQPFVGIAGRPLEVQAPQAARASPEPPVPVGQDDAELEVTPFRLANRDLPKDHLVAVMGFLSPKDTTALAQASKDMRFTVRQNTPDPFLRDVFREQERVWNRYGTFKAPADSDDLALTDAIETAQGQKFSQALRDSNQEYLQYCANNVESAFRQYPLFRASDAARLLLTLGRLHEAEQICRWRIELDDADSMSCRIQLARALILSERTPEAVDELQDFARNSPQLDLRFARLLNGEYEALLEPCNYDIFPLRELALYSLGRLDPAEQSAMQPFNLMFLDAWRGDVKGALTGIEGFMRRQFGRAGVTKHERLSNLHLLVNRMKMMPIKDDPQFLKFLESVHMAPAQLATVRFTIPETIEYPPPPIFQPVFGA